MSINIQMEKTASNPTGYLGFSLHDNHLRSMVPKSHDLQATTPHNFWPNDTKYTVGTRVYSSEANSNGVLVIKPVSRRCRWPGSTSRVRDTGSACRQNLKMSTLAYFLVEFNNRLTSIVERLIRIWQDSYLFQCLSLRILACVKLRFHVAVNTCIEGFR